jgi:tight adherence protein C
MILVLIGALVLTGSAVALLGRALLKPRMQATETVAEVRSYGFKGTRVTPREAHPDRGLALLPRLDSLAAKIGDAVARHFPSLGSKAIRQNLTAAGMYTTSPGQVLGYQTLGGIGLPVLWLWLAISGHVSGLLVVLGAGTAVLAGWGGPSYYIRRRGEARLDRIEHEMPELIDALVTMVEAGIAFAGALQMAGRRFRGPLGHELRLTIQEQNMGLGMSEALSNMLKRVDRPSVRSFVRSMVQGELLGVPIAQTLRSLATEMRKRRRQAAEERAQKAPIKMLFPLVFLIFPSMFLILLGPALLRVGEIFGG